MFIIIIGGLSQHNLQFEFNLLLEVTQYCVMFNSCYSKLTIVLLALARVIQGSKLVNNTTGRV